jgi:signal transduction histidine kinase
MNDKVKIIFHVVGWGFILVGLYLASLYSYSVSHDLRVPLRSIDGFSQALLEDYPDKLDEQGKDYIQRVRAGAQHMAELIDALLTLSRVTRSVYTFYRGGVAEESEGSAG